MSGRSFLGLIPGATPEQLLARDFQQPDSGVAPVVTIQAGFLISSGGSGDTDIEIPIAL